MAKKFQPKHTVEKDGYVFASPDMKGMLNASGKPWTTRTIFLYNVEQVLYKHNKWHSKRQKPVSEATKSHRFIECKAMAHHLQDLGYRIHFPTQIKRKHVLALTRYWEGKSDLMPASIIQKVSILKVYLRWLGKETMLEQMTPEDMFAEPERFKRSLVAKKDKSWSPSGNPVEIISGVIQEDERVGKQLMLSHLFGLRVKESWCFKPLRDYNKQEQVIFVRDGSKGGRPRTVLVSTPQQREFLEELCEFVNDNTESLIPRRRSLGSWRNYFYKVMNNNGISRKNGLVPHGLRHGYAHEQFEKHAGHPAAVKEQKKAEDMDAIQERVARLLVSEQLGHRRESITSAYTGK